MGDNGANECNMALIPWEAGGKGSGEVRNSGCYHRHNSKDSNKGSETLKKQEHFSHTQFSANLTPTTCSTTLIFVNSLKIQDKNHFWRRST